MSRRFFHCICVLLLLMAQQGALVHATWHAGSDARAQASPAQEQQRDGRQDSSRPGSKTSLCAFDLAFGQVLGGTHSPCTPFAFIAAAVECIRDPALPQLRAAALTPKSRGPPVLL
jgi:hypothetical protein